MRVGSRNIHIFRTLLQYRTVKGLYFAAIQLFILMTVVFQGDIYATGPNNNNTEEGKTDSVSASVLITDSTNLLVSSRPDKDMDPGSLMGMIDSVLNMKSIPMDILDKIMFFSESKITPERPFFPFPTDTTMYPGNVFYNSWVTDNTNPYTNELSNGDTSLTLIIADSASNCGFAFPLEDSVVITSRYGWREGGYHKGIDLDLNVWDPVYSAFPGIVRCARVHGAYGRVVVVRHFNGFETTYAHLHRIKVKAGQEIEAGHRIGLGGSSGHSTGSHLHFEVKFKGLPIDPEHIIDFKTKALISDTVELVKRDGSYAALPEGCKTHVVVKGENIYTVARKYKTTTRKIAKLNGISRRRPLRPGQKLRVG